jgi:hypothetical protein
MARRKKTDPTAAPEAPAPEAPAPEQAPAEGQAPEATNPPAEAPEAAPAAAEAPASPEAAVAPEGPTLEARVKALETALGQANQLVTRQAAVIVQAAENAEELKKSREKVGKLEARMNDAKAAAASAKKAYETAVEEHFSLEEELSTGQGRLPFPPPEAEAEPELTPPISTAPLAAAIGAMQAPAEGEEWRGVELSTLDPMPTTLVAVLAEANIRTVGDIADFTKPSPTGFCKRLTDIPGVGKAKAEKIEAALDWFWSSRAAAGQAEALSPAEAPAPELPAEEAPAPAEAENSTQAPEAEPEAAPEAPGEQPEEAPDPQAAA